jgi:hypothetical protein
MPEFVRKLWRRPPKRSFASRSVTCLSRKAAAATKPATPPPMTIIFFGTLPPLAFNLASPIREWTTKAIPATTGAGENFITKQLIMKTGKLSWMLTLAIAVMALLTQRAHALYTTYLTQVSNQVAQYATTVTNAAEGRAITNALKALSKPSTSVAEDYNLFVAATLKLGQFALADPNLFNAGSNTFAFFLNEAGGEIGATGARIAALNDFVKTKKAASNNLAQALATLNSAVTNPNPQLALLQGRQVFSKLKTANKLAAVGEAHSGFAPSDLDGKLLTHTEANSSGTVLLEPSGNFKADGSPDPNGTFTYTRTGLNTGTLVLNHDPGDDVTTAKLTFKTATSGNFTEHTESADGDTNSKGTFTIQ